MQDAQDLLAKKAADEKTPQERQHNGSYAGSAHSKLRRCGTCGKAGHNARTCPETAESSASSISDVIVVDY
jgi:ribosomal protein L32